MPQTFAIILFLNSFKILLLFPNTLLLFSHYSLQENIVNTCYTAASVNIQHSVAGKRQQRLYVRYRQIRVFRQQQQINYTICALIHASVTTAHFHHTPYFRMETLAIILKLFSIPYCCYYSQNYSGIIISGLSIDRHDTPKRSCSSLQSGLFNAGELR